MGSEGGSAVRSDDVVGSGVSSLGGRGDGGERVGGSAMVRNVKAMSSIVVGT